MIRNALLFVVWERKGTFDRTGLGVSNIREIVDSLTILPVIVVTTHVHWDQIGGHQYFNNIAVHEPEAEWLSDKFPIPIQIIKNNLTKFPCDFLPQFDIDSYRIFQGMPQKIFNDGEVFDLGDRRIQVIHTPGHSLGHCCFYEPDRNYLFFGDLIYKGCLYAFYPTTDLVLFYGSVRRVQKYKITKILLGHHQLSIPVSMIDEIEAGFAQIERSGKLKQGNGLFEFSNFQIHI